MSAKVIIAELSARGIVLTATGDRLTYRAPEGVVTPQVLATLKAHKPALLAWLAQGADALNTGRLQPGAPAHVLSAAQRQLWIAEQAQDATAAYNIPFALRLRGRLDHAALETALRGIVERHHVLRTCYRERGGEPEAFLRDADAFVVEREAIAPDKTESALREQVHAQANRPFDLERELPIRVRVLDLGADDCALLLTVHHIAADGASVGVLAGELHARYAAALAGHGTDVDATSPGLQYADFARWQSEWLQGPAHARLAAYWRGRMDGAPAVSTLTGDRPRPPHALAAGTAWRQRIPAALSRQLRRVARQHGVTDFALLLGAYALLLSRHGSEDDVVIGVPASGRLHAEAAGLIGCFTNTLPMRIAVPGNNAVDTYLQRIHSGLLEDLDHQALPFEAICKVLDVERGGAYHPAFQWMFGLNRTPDVGALFPGVEAENLVERHETSPFDCNLSIAEDGDSYLATWEYATALFDAPTIERLGAEYLQVLARMVEAPDSRIDAIGLLDATRHAHALQLGAGPALASMQARDGAVAQVLARAREDAGRVAVVDATATVTYAELVRQAARLVLQLRAHGVRAGDCVGVGTGPGAHWVASMLGVLASGASYVPIDPQLPAARRAQILEDAAVSVVLGDAAERADWEGLACTLLAADGADAADAPAFEPACALLDGDVARDATAYVMFTSGSTGRPKGVCVDHHALDGHLLGMRQAWSMQAEDRVLAFLSLSIDGSIEQILCALGAGAQLHLRGPELWTAAECARQLVARGITITDLPVAYLSLLMSQPDAVAALRTSRLRLLSTGGDTVPPELVQAWHGSGLSSQFALYNAYGPSEATITATLYRVDAATCAHTVSIGRALAGRRAHVIDRYGHLLAPGATGELLLAGHGIAQGYLRRPQLSAERFIADPFQPGARAYRTGDRARMRADGNLEFLGRFDDQIKVRGFRIEPAEIENCLLSAPGVEQAVVILHGEGATTRLLVAAAGATLEASARARLLAHLQSRLPAYMWPHAFCVLAALPQQTNGKFDRAALTRVILDSDTGDGAAPETPMQHALAQLWAQALGVEAVAVDADYFGLGGDSIIAIQIVAAARARGIQLSPRQFFQHPTVRAMAEVVRECEAQAATDHDPAGFALSPASIEYLEHDAGRRTRFHLGLSLQVPLVLDAAAWEVVTAQLLAAHPALRQRVDAANHTVTLASDVAAEARRIASHHRLDAADPARQRADIDAALQASMDPMDGPVCRLAYLAEGDAGGQVLLVVHHLAADAVSLQVLLRDLNVLLGQHAQGRALQLVADTGGVAAYRRRLAQLPAQDADYWRALAARPLAPLVTGATGLAQAGNFDRIDLQHPLSGTGSSEAQLLAALFSALADWRAAPEWGVLIERHGRDAFDELDLAHSVGWFTAIFPLCLRVGDSAAAAVPALVGEVRDALAAVPNRGVGYGHWRHVERLPELVAWEQAHGPRVSFNYFGRLDRRVDTRGPAVLDARHPFDGMGADVPRPEWLAVSAAIVDDALQLQLDYDRTRLSQAEVAQLAALLAARLASAHAAAPAPVAAPAPPRCIDATPMQEFMLHQTAFDPDGIAYLTQLHFLIEGEFCPARFRTAWEIVAASHQALRSCFRADGDGAYQQVIDADAALPWQLLRAGEAGAPTDEAGFRALIARDARLPFAGDGQVPMRFTLVELAPRQFGFLWTHHHALLDGWSVSIVIGHVLSAYQQLRQGMTPRPRRSPPLQDYTGWLSRHGRDEAADFWRRRMAGFAAPTRVLDWLVDARAASDRFGVVTGEFDAAVLDGLKARARRWSVSLGSLLQAALAVLLHRFAPGDEVSYGLTTAGRPPELANAEAMVGMFINTIPMRLTVDADAHSLRGLAAQVHALAGAANEWSFLPLPEIARAAGLPPSKPLFEALFVFENYPKASGDDLLEALGATIRDFAGREYSEYPLTLIAGASGQGLHYQLLFHRTRLRDGFADRLVATYGRILDLLAGAAEDVGADWTVLDFDAGDGGRVVDAAGRPVPGGCAGTLPCGTPDAPQRATVGTDGGIVGLDHLLPAANATLVDRDAIHAALGALPDVGGIAIHLDDASGIVQVLVAAADPDTRGLRQQARRLLEARLPAAVVAVVRIEFVSTLAADSGDVLAASARRPGGEQPENALEARMAALWGEVLDTAPPSVHDNFFELGGDSLHAVRLLARMRAEHQFQVEIGDLALHPTIRLLSRELDSRRNDNALFSRLVAGPADTSEDETATEELLL